MGSEYADEARKLAGKGRDVAGPSAFPANDDAAYIPGQTINVVGGLIMSQYAHSNRN